MSKVFQNLPPEKSIPSLIITSSSNVKLRLPQWCSPQEDWVHKSKATLLKFHHCLNCRSPEDARPEGTRETASSTFPNLQLPWRQAQTSPQTQHDGCACRSVRASRSCTGLSVSCPRTQRQERLSPGLHPPPQLASAVTVYTCWFCLNVALCRPEM